MKRLVATPDGSIEVDMTPQEIAERQAEEAAWQAQNAIRTWRKRIAETDAKIPRSVEDIIDALDTSVRDKLAQETKDAYELKKLIRSQKPQEV